MSRTIRPWDDDEPRLRALVAQGHTAAECARELGRPLASVQSKITRLGVGPIAQARAAAPLRLQGATIERSVRHEGPVEVVAPLETAEESDEAFLARVVGRTEREVAKSDAASYATLRIASDRPIALSISSDWHLSPTGACDVRGLLAYADAIASTPGAYAVSVGDLTDNPIKHRPSAPREVSDELRLLDLTLGRFRGKMLGMTSGNHDDWTIAFAGVDNLATMARRHRIHYAPAELIYVVEIVNPADVDEVTARWVVATRHQFYRNSTMNDTHACERWLESAVNAWPRDTDGRTLLPDVLAMGHNHVAVVSQKTTPRGVVTFCRMGAWQRASAHTKQYGWVSAPPTAPTIVLPPTRSAGPEGQPHAYADYRRALEYVAGRPVAPAADDAAA